MSLAILADHMASKGRGPDSMLIHMAPSEVQGLQALAEHHGGSLTINPETGLPEAGFLDKLLPMIIGAALAPLTAGTSLAFLGATPFASALTVGGFEALRTGDIGKGISAGLGAYGGASLGANLASSGAQALGAEATGVAAGEAGALAAGEAGRIGLEQGLSGEALEAFKAQAMDQAASATSGVAANATTGKMMSAGLDKAVANPMDYLKTNAKPLMYAAAPLLAGSASKSNMPTTVTKPGMIRPYSFDPYGGTYTAGTPYEAKPIKVAEGGLMGMADGGYSPGMLDFTQRSEPVARMAQGGIVALAEGGTPGSVEELYKTYAGRGSDPEGLAFWTQSFGDTIDANEAASFQNAVTAARAKGTEPGDVTQAQANTMVQDMYRNVLNRDAEQSGLNYWSDLIQGSNDPNKVYNDFLKSAQANTEIGKFNTSFEQATTPYTGYKSADTGSNADEWVRNVLGREVTDADRNQQWYKDMGGVTKVEEAKAAYNDFLASTGAKTNMDWMAASQLSPLSIKKAVNLPGGVSGGGNTYVNPNGTITTAPNIPGRPEDGFTGMKQVRDAYTAGGGSLGYLSPTYTREQFRDKYENALTGGSKQSYDYLTGKKPYDPTPYTPTGEIMKPYFESVGKFPAQEKNRNKKYVFINGKYELNPDFVKPSYVLAAEKAVLANPDKEPTTDPGAGKKWVFNTVDKKWEAKSAEEAAATNNTGGASGDYTSQDQSPGNANGGLMAMARGGMAGQYDLGGYSDGGRLLRGPGDGVSDSIPATIGNKRPARLADGEFVVPARIVSELGNGSTEAGARKLYAMMERVQAARRGTVGKKKVAKNSRADKYLPA